MNKRIGLGTWAWGNKLFWDYQKNIDSDLRETFEESVKRGFYIIDTADSYGTGNLKGRSEELLGKFINEYKYLKKNKIKVATKLAPYPWRIGNKGFNKPFLKSLERLQRIDIVQLHWSTARYNPFQELQLLDNLSDLIDQGYNFEIGLSNIGPQRLNKIIKYLSFKGKRLKSVQVQFSLLAPNLDKQKLVKQICDKNNIDFIAYSPLSFGLLCQKTIAKKIQKKSFLRRSLFKIYDKPTMQLRNVIEEIANYRSVSTAQVAINWCCYQGIIPIIGITKKKYVQDIAGVFKWNLNKEEFEKLETVSNNCKKKMPSNPFTSN